MNKQKPTFSRSTIFSVAVFSGLLSLGFSTMPASADVGIHQGHDSSGRVICDFRNYPSKSEMDALAHIAEYEINVSTDRGWKVSNITQKVWDHWGWFDDYTDARANYIKATGSVLNYKQVDAAVMSVAKLACKNIW